MTREIDERPNPTPPSPADRRAQLEVLWRTFQREAQLPREEISDGGTVAVGLRDGTVTFKSKVARWSPGKNC